MEAMDEDHPFELEVSSVGSACKLPCASSFNATRCHRRKLATTLGMQKLTDFCSFTRSALGPHSARTHFALLLLSLARQVPPCFCTHTSRRLSSQCICLLQTENTQRYFDAASRLPGYSVDR